jgi:hypothetical protein
MKILLPASAVACAAFCLWLTVRIANRRERWARWTMTAVVGLAVLYVVSIGPAIMLVNQERCPIWFGDIFSTVYGPSLRLTRHAPWPIRHAIVEWLFLWGGLLG